MLGPMGDIQRHCDEVKEIKTKQSTYKAMMAFKQEHAAKLWKETAGRFCLALVDNDDLTPDYGPRLWLIDAQAGEVVERWDREPAVDEIVVSAMGECTCPPEGDACPTCGVLRALVDGDELPF